MKTINSEWFSADDVLPGNENYKIIRCEDRNLAIYYFKGFYKGNRWVFLTPHGDVEMSKVTHWSNSLDLTQ